MEDEMTPILEAASRRDAAIKAAQDEAWNERQRILRECADKIEAAWNEYHAVAWRGLHRISERKAA
jgi:acyl-CoA reductase-like NAD-dependent aldehyde dehydrogenase